MRRPGIVALVAACAAGAGGIVLVAAADERELAFKANVRMASVVAVTRPGQEACQYSLQASARFDVVEVPLATGPRPGPPLVVTVREPGGRPIARGRVAPGAREGRPVRARVAPAVEEGRFISVCLRNAGTREVGFHGGPNRESVGQAGVGGRPVDGDIALVFLRAEPRSAGSLVPEMFSRASLLRPDPVGPWTFWLLLVAVAAGVPALLAAALRSVVSAAPAASPSEDPPSPPEPPPSPPDPPRDPA